MHFTIKFMQRNWFTSLRICIDWSLRFPHEYSRRILIFDVVLESWDLAWDVCKRFSFNRKVAVKILSFSFRAISIKFPLVCKIREFSFPIKYSKTFAWEKKPKNSKMHAQSCNVHSPYQCELSCIGQEWLRASALYFSCCHSLSFSRCFSFNNSIALGDSFCLHNFMFGWKVKFVQWSFAM